MSQVMPVWGWSAKSRLAFLRLLETSSGFSVKPTMTPFRITIVPFSARVKFWTQSIGIFFMKSSATDEGVCCVIAESIQIAFTMPTE